jgi:methylated-DNA-[protein]-cysteine S-methyltransferase
MAKNFTTYLKTPIGLLAVTATDQFVIGVDFVSKQKNSSANKISKQAVKELAEYFSGKREKFSVPIFYTGTTWQNKVWNKLLNVPYGSVISYKDLATAVGKTKAARAVGQAVNKNPIAIIVPCHRVIGSRGDLVGYAGGLRKKQQLLLLEGLK